MIDLHCHILPSMDDGARDLGTALNMARIAVSDGVAGIVCTPHILPGLYHNTGSRIFAAIAGLRDALSQSNIALDLFSGADAHMAPHFIDKIESGKILTLAHSRYVLVEPPHHIAPIRLEQFFFELLAANYVPILTHPERLMWLPDRFDTIKYLVRSGVWMQITAGSLLGKFGRRSNYWAERMLDEGIVHVIASDAHDDSWRPPDLSLARKAASRWVGQDETTNLVSTRPRGVIENVAASDLPPPPALSIPPLSIPA
ncbi:MAG TPA: CpsB/CapC family capsule biosynthesis tyrosine phosphatase [Rhizomicrobium sp.]|nr:CpsB/CapC family capsule biosynthesis tyrosine phosphatase [Rhizomicrobium sp.]